VLMIVVGVSTLVMVEGMKFVERGKVGFGDNTRL